jgi:hypothetical protein
VITAVAVGPNGQPINGYQEAPSPGNVTAVTDCTKPSLVAVGDDIYSCSPSAADADTCWPSTPGSLLCVGQSAGQAAASGDLRWSAAACATGAVTDPFALLLDEGTRCRLRNGGAWGGRDDGYVGVYGCGAPDSNLALLWLPSQGPGTCVDRSTPAWTVKVGQVGTPSEHFPPPQVHTVSTAWLAGD